MFLLGECGCFYLDFLLWLLFYLVRLYRIMSVGRNILKTFYFALLNSSTGTFGEASRNYLQLSRAKNVL